MDAPSDVGPSAPPGATRPPAPPGGWPGPRRLRRRPDDGHIAGVCAGVAEYFNVDPVLVRIAAVVLAFSGPGVFAYILAWIFVPAAEGPARHVHPRAPIDPKERSTQIFGLVLLGVAVSVMWGDWWVPGRRWLFPVGLMALGGWLLLRDDRHDATDRSDPVPPPVPPTDEATLTGPAGPSGADPASVTDEVQSSLVDDSYDESGDPPRPPWDVPPPPVPPVPPVPPPGARRRRMIGPIVFGALLVWSGLAWLAGMSVQTGLAVGLLIIGVGFVLGAFVGGSRALIIPALLVGGALAVTAVVDIPLSGPVGQQRWSPQRVEEVDDRYEVSVGEGTLDLSAIDLPDGELLEVAASVGLGHLVVLVPEHLAVDASTEVGGGESQVFGLTQEGMGITTDQLDEEGSTGGTLELDLQVGLGRIEVRRTSEGSGSTPAPTSASTTSSSLG